MSFFTTIAKLLLLAAPSVHAFAIFKPSTFPDVVPGPGMPSLASIGVTTTSLYTQAYTLLNNPPNSPTQAQHLLSIPGNSKVSTQCISDIKFSYSAEVLASFLYLRALGTMQCSIRGLDGTRLWVKSGDAHVWGKNLGTEDVLTSSTCSDIATSLGQLISECVLPQRGGSFGGQALAKGNNNLAIQLQGSEQIPWSPIPHAKQTRAAPSMEDYIRLDDVTEISEIKRTAEGGLVV